jgi:hypothetical protein
VFSIKAIAVPGTRSVVFQEVKESTAAIFSRELSPIGDNGTGYSS